MNNIDICKSYPVSANTHLSANRNTKNVPILNKICGKFTKMYAFQLFEWSIEILSYFFELNWSELGLFKQSSLFTEILLYFKIVEGLYFRLWLKEAWIEPRGWCFFKKVSSGHFVGMCSVYSITPFIRFFFFLYVNLYKHVLNSILIGYKSLHSKFSNLNVYYDLIYWKHIPNKIYFTFLKDFEDLDRLGVDATE